MKKVLVIGASSGIGYELVMGLITRGYEVWATSRNTIALNDLVDECKHFGKVNISKTDVTLTKDITILSETLKKANFVPDIIVLSTGIANNDLDVTLHTDITREIMETNYFGALNCIREFLPLIKPSGQFIAISSTSAIKGTAYQGVGYGGSKAALSLAFESFYMKWFKTGPLFTTIFFGPVETPLHKPKRTRLFLMSTKQAAKCIIKAIEKRKPVYYRPTTLFLFLRVSRLLPTSLYLRMMIYLENKIQ